MGDYVWYEMNKGYYKSLKQDQHMHRDRDRKETARATTEEETNAIMAEQRLVPQSTNRIIIN